METVEITFNDLEDLRQILNACLNYFVAKDLERAQIKFSAVAKSPLTQELEILKTRFDGYLADYLLLRHEAENAEDEEEVIEIDEEEIESEPEIEEPELAAMPLGKTEFPKQKGRRVTKEELQKRAEDGSG